MSKMSYYLSYHDTHTINEEKVLYKVLKEECEQEVNNFVYLFCKHINQRSITTNFHFDSMDSSLSRGYVSAQGKIMYCVSTLINLTFLGTYPRLLWHRYTVKQKYQNIIIDREKHWIFVNFYLDILAVIDWNDILNKTLPVNFPRHFISFFIGYINRFLFDKWMHHNNNFLKKNNH